MTRLTLVETTYKFLIDSELKARVDEVFEQHGTSLTAGTSRLLSFFVNQPPELRAMMLGQIPPSDDLIDLVLRRMQQPPAVAGKISRPPPEAIDENLEIEEIGDPRITANDPGKKKPAKKRRAPTP